MMSRNTIYSFGLIALTVIVALLDIRFGSVSIPEDAFWNALALNATEGDPYHIILWKSRIPRMFLAIISGAGLSVCGLLMQTLFRNPMAGPYVLGISSGAGVGVAVMTMGITIFGLHELPGWSLAMSGVAGAFLIMIVLMMAASRIADNVTILVLGILIGGISSAFVSLLQYFSPDVELKQFVMWTLGSLDAVKPGEVLMICMVILLGTGMSFVFHPGLNAVLLGENTARNLGINTRSLRYFTIGITALIAGVITAYCGPIGFVGIITPHITRLIFKVDDHKILIPATCLVGGLILLIADLIAHVPGTFIILPLNAITSILGIPVLIWIIVRNKQISTSFT